MGHRMQVSSIPRGRFIFTSQPDLIANPDNNPTPIAASHNTLTNAELSPLEHSTNSSTLLLCPQHSLSLLYRHGPPLRGFVGGDQGPSRSPARPGPLDPSCGGNLLWCGAPIFASISDAVLQQHPPGKPTKSTESTPAARTRLDVSSG